MMKDVVKSNISTLYCEDSTGFLAIRNGKKNLLSEPEFVDTEVFKSWIEKHNELKALIIYGEGRHFSHGADTSLFSDPDVADTVSEKLEKAKNLLNIIENLPLVTVAAISGGCFGGGLEIAMSCALRICSERSYLGLTEIMHGVVPGMNGMERLCKLVGKEEALMMCLTGGIISAKDALEKGIVTIVTDENPLDASIALVKEMTEGKSTLLIKSVVDTINKASGDCRNFSDGKFEAVLREVQGK